MPIFKSHWYDSTPKKIPVQAGFEPGIIRPRGGHALPLGQRGGVRGTGRFIAGYRLSRLLRRSPCKAYRIARDVTHQHLTNSGDRRTSLVSGTGNRTRSQWSNRPACSTRHYWGQTLFRSRPLTSQSLVQAAFLIGEFLFVHVLTHCQPSVTVTKES